MILKPKQGGPREKGDIAALDSQLPMVVLADLLIMYQPVLNGVIGFASTRAAFTLCWPSTVQCRRLGLSLLSQHDAGFRQDWWKIS